MNTSLNEKRNSKQRWPVFDEEQRAAVEQVLQSGKVNYWTGQEGKCFEDEYAQHLGVQHTVAVANGTVALELALFAVGLNNNDEVVIPSRTFIGTASAVVARGGSPVCADIDTATQNVTTETLKAAVTEKTRGIIVVHLGGWPCDMDSIMEFAKERCLFVIEDCAQAHGAEYKGKPVGSFGDINAFSFCQDKIITTGGEGGLLATNDRELWERAWSYKDHGKNWDTVHSQNQTGGFRYLHDSFGSNYRMTEMQAAIGRLQLKKLPEWHHHRSKNAMALRDSLFGCPGLSVPRPEVDYEHAYYRLYALMDKSQLTADWNRDQIIKNCQARGIQVGSGSCGEIYLEKAFQQFSTPPRLPGAFQAQETSLAFVVDPTFTERDMQHVGKIVVDVMRKATSTIKQRRLRAA